MALARGHTCGAGARAHVWRCALTLMNEFMMDIALEEIPVSGCTCLSTL